MKKILQRLLMFSFGLPIVVAVVLLLPQMNNLATNVAAVVFSAIGAVEFAAIIGKRSYKLPAWEAAVLGASAPLATTLVVSFGVGYQMIPTIVMIGAAWVMSSRILSPASELSGMADRVVSGFSVMIYPGVFLLWIVRMGALPHAPWIVLVFLFTVFANDSLAWLFGLLFGKGNRGVVPASPNKSVAGFVGGFAASVSVGVAGVLLLPEAFRPVLLGPVLSGALLGAASGVAAIVGDLAESTIKRSAEVKDSGRIIPGRGGVLDSIDSVAMAAPVFFAVFVFLFK